jgi:hypothetical protein
MMGLRLAFVATVLVCCCTPGLWAASLSYQSLSAYAKMDAIIAFDMAASNTQPRVLVIGDKLVEEGTKQQQGWVSKLKQAYKDSVELFSLGSNLAHAEGECRCAKSEVCFVNTAEGVSHTQDTSNRLAPHCTTTSCQLSMPSKHVS